MPLEPREPIINETIRQHVRAALAVGLPPVAVRASTIAKFVEAFAENDVASEFVEDYRRQVTTVVDAAIKGPGVGTP